MARKKSGLGRFRSAHETPVTMFIEGRPSPLRLLPEESYETEDPAELEALRGSADVREMESTEGSKK